MTASFFFFLGKLKIVLLTCGFHGGHFEDKTSKAFLDFTGFFMKFAPKCFQEVKAFSILCEHFCYKKSTLHKISCNRVACELQTVTTRKIEDLL